MDRAIDGILFDLGETLLEFGRVDIPAMFEAGARQAYEYLTTLGLEVPQFEKFHRRQLWAIRWSYFKSHFTRREFNTLDVLGRLGQKMGHDLSAEQMVELAWQWYLPLSLMAKPEPGTRELLEKLHRSGLKLGLVSNTFVHSRVLDRHLERENLLDLLPVRVYSCDVRYRKPHPKIFQEALDRCGLTASRTLFVGDSPSADIVGANRLGLISVLKDPAGKFARKGAPHHRIQSLHELPGIVQQYNG